MEVSRRKFIKRLLPILGAVVLAPTALSSCGGDEPDSPKGCGDSCTGSARAGCGNSCSESCVGSSKNGCGASACSNGCSNSASNGAGSNDGLAPASMVGKIIKWYEHNSDGTGGNTVKVKFVNDTDLQSDFAGFTTYTYTKKSANLAHLNFMATQNVVGVVRTFQYDFDLEFNSISEFKVSGTLRVNYLSGPNVGKTYFTSFTGTGYYIDSLF